MVRQWKRASTLALIAMLVALGGCGGASGTTGEPANHFDAAGAWKLIERQVAVGQRPAGSPQLRRLSAELRPLLPAGRFERIPGESALRNVVGRLPGAQPAIVLGAHYDTLAKPKGFVGANNGAAGTAIVIEAARALRAMPAGVRPREIRFVLFDGEEPAVGLPEQSTNFYREGLRGSRAYVAAHRGQTAAMILLDYVGNRSLRLPREATSSRALWSRLLLAADAVESGGVFRAATGPGIVDDHTPFLRAGVPAVDLIDWRYPGHGLADGLDRLSRRSIDSVGEAVVQLISELRSE